MYKYDFIVMPFFGKVRRKGAKWRDLRTKAERREPVERENQGIE